MKTPQQVFGLNEAETLKANMVEEAIDAALSAGADKNQNKIAVSKEILDATVKVLANVTSKYRAGGWDVAETDDQLTFSPVAAKRPGRPRKRNADTPADTPAEPTAPVNPVGSYLSLMYNLIDVSSGIAVRVIRPCLLALDTTLVYLQSTGRIC